MRDETPEQPAPLRSGYTTGSCATATRLAAARLLLAAKSSERAEIMLPKGQHVLDAARVLPACGGDSELAEAGTVKDAGDDPDVTHGAIVFARVRLSSNRACGFSRGAGRRHGDARGPFAGRRRAGDQPRAAQDDDRTSRSARARTRLYGRLRSDASASKDGEALALKTMNPRLGIVGGLSILGTTGIVRPFSCSAYIASIHQGIDVARANGYTHIAACTGNAERRRDARALRTAGYRARSKWATSSARCSST